MTETKTKTKRRENRSHNYFRALFLLRNHFIPGFGSNLYNQLGDLLVRFLNQLGRFLVRFVVQFRVASRRILFLDFLGCFFNQFGCFLGRFLHQLGRFHGRFLHQLGRFLGRFVAQFRVASRRVPFLDFRRRFHRHRRLRLDARLHFGWRFATCFSGFNLRRFEVSQRYRLKNHGWQTGWVLSFFVHFGSRTILERFWKRSGPVRKCRRVGHGSGTVPERCQDGARTVPEQCQNGARTVPAQNKHGVGPTQFARHKCPALRAKTMLGVHGAAHPPSESVARVCSLSGKVEPWRKRASTRSSEWVSGWTPQVGVS